MNRALDRIFRGAAGRIISALAARFRDLDLAEEAFSEACLVAARVWPDEGDPIDPAAWLYRVALRRALDAIRRSEVRARFTAGPPEPVAIADEIGDRERDNIPDERLRLIFVCCHPAIAPDARAALTLRLVCGLSVREIASSFLVSEVAMYQRLTRAKRKIGLAGVPFTVPGPAEWPDRLEAVLVTLEVAYAKAHEDSAGNGPHAGFAAEILALTELLAEMLPDQAEVLGLGALVRYAEARRPARTDANNVMVPLARQDPALWDRALIGRGDLYLQRARNQGAVGYRALHAAIHGLWCARRSLDEVPPWPAVLAVYDAMLWVRDDLVVRLNRAVALAEVNGPQAALEALDILTSAALDNFPPWHAVRANLLRRLGRIDESRCHYDRAIALSAGSAEQAWLKTERP